MLVYRAVARSVSCWSVEWDGTNVDEVSRVTGMPVERGADLVLTCPVTGKSRKVEVGQVIGRWDDGSVTIFSAHAFRKQYQTVNV